MYHMPYPKHNMILHDNNTDAEVLNTVQKATIHQVTTMLATSKNVLFPHHSHLLTTDTDDPSRAIINVSGHQYQWLASGYNLEIGHL